MGTIVVEKILFYLERSRSASEVAVRAHHRSFVDPETINNLISKAKKIGGEEAGAILRKKIFSPEGQDLIGGFGVNIFKTSEIPAQIRRDSGHEHIAVIRNMSIPWSTSKLYQTVPDMKHIVTHEKLGFAQEPKLRSVSDFINLLTGKNPYSSSALPQGSSLKFYTEESIGRYLYEWSSRLWGTKDSASKLQSGFIKVISPQLPQQLYYNRDISGIGEKRKEIPLPSAGSYKVYCLHDPTSFGVELHGSGTTPRDYSNFIKRTTGKSLINNLNDFFVKKKDGSISKTYAGRGILKEGILPLGIVYKLYYLPSRMDVRAVRIDPKVDLGVTRSILQKTFGENIPKYISTGNGEKWIPLGAVSVNDSLARNTRKTFDVETNTLRFVSPQDTLVYFPLSLSSFKEGAFIPLSVEANTKSSAIEAFLKKLDEIKKNSKYSYQYHNLLSLWSRSGHKIITRRMWEKSRNKFKFISRGEPEDTRVEEIGLLSVDEDFRRKYMNRPLDTMYYQWALSDEDRAMPSVFEDVAQLDDETKVGSLLEVFAHLVSQVVESELSYMSLVESYIQQVREDDELEEASDEEVTEVINDLDDVKELQESADNSAKMLDVLHRSLAKALVS
jgi:hypothetical protein